MDMGSSGSMREPTIDCLGERITTVSLTQTKGCLPDECNSPILDPSVYGFIVGTIPSPRPLLHEKTTSSPDNVVDPVLNFFGLRLTVDPTPLTISDPPLNIDDPRIAAVDPCVSPMIRRGGPTVRSVVVGMTHLSDGLDVRAPTLSVLT